MSAIAKGGHAFNNLDSPILFQLQGGVLGRIELLPRLTDLLLVTLTPLYRLSICTAAVVEIANI